MPLRTPSLAHAEWLSCASAQAVFRAIEAGGYGARAVGGSVRNALIGLAVRDVDIATPAVPGEVERLAAAAGLRCVPTGIDHGTITVVSGGIPYEVTTLRRDVETFGRKARIAFSTDWAEDARRRDFTINALYCSRDGTVHDPLGGYDDLAARRVRFIGAPRERIREDYLRILRFFRFSAEYGRGDPDAPSLAACVAERGGLALLSAERVRAELMKLLVAPGVLAAVRAMTDGGITALVVAEMPDVALLHRLIDVEAALGVAGDAVLRLAALGVRESEDAARMRDRLRLSTVEADELAAVAGHHPDDLAYDPATSERAARARLYRLGAGPWTKRGLFVWAETGAEPGDAARRQRLELPQRWPVPVLPARGSDVMALGVAAGPAIGRILSELEAWWVGADFPADKGLIEAALRRCVAQERARHQGT